jgi:glycine/serine hydroxymethyltransferase
MEEKAVSEVAHLICRVLDDHDQQPVLDEVSEQVDALCADYPLYENL